MIETPRDPTDVAKPNHLVTMAKYSTKSALEKSSKSSKNAECLLSEETAAKRIQLEAKKASKEGLEKAERDQRQESYREKKEREEKEKADEMEGTQLEAEKEATEENEKERKKGRKRRKRLRWRENKWRQKR